jgi:hypothetical protein
MKHIVATIVLAALIAGGLVVASCGSTRANETPKTTTVYQTQTVPAGLSYSEVWN